MDGQQDVSLLRWTPPEKRESAVQVSLPIGVFLGRGTVPGVSSSSMSRKHCTFEVHDGRTYMVALGKNPVPLRGDAGQTIGLEAGQRAELHVGLRFMFVYDKPERSPTFEVVKLPQVGKKRMKPVLEGEEQEELPELFRVSATRIASHYHLSCDRFLFLASQKGNAQNSGNTYVADLFEKGRQWENSLVAEWSQKQLLHSFHEKFYISTAHTFLKLCQHADGFPLGEVCYAHGMVLYPGDAFREHLYEGKKVAFSFSKAVIDFVQLKRVGLKEIEITVIDAKSSKRVKLYHCIQVVYYVIILEYLVSLEVVRKALGEWRVRISEVGGVWLPSSDFPKTMNWEPFAVALIKPRLLSWLRVQLPRILAPEIGLDDMDWRFNSGCQQCTFRDGCQKQVRADGLISSIPYLAGSEHAMLEALLSEAGFGIPAKVQDLKNATDKMGRLSFEATAEKRLTHRSLVKVLSLRPQSQSSSPVLLAQLNGRAYMLPKKCFLLPDPRTYQSVVRIGLALLFNPNEQLVGWAAKTNQQKNSLVGNDESSLCNSLHSLLMEIASLPGKIYLQAYVFGEQERSLFLEVGMAAVATGQPTAHKWMEILSMLFVDPRMLNGHALPELMERVGGSAPSEARNLYNAIKGLGYEPVGTDKSSLQGQLAQLVSNARKRFLRCPALVAVHTIVRQNVAMPAVGFFGFDDTQRALLEGGSDNQQSLELSTIYAQKEDPDQMLVLLSRRSEKLLEMVDSISANDCVNGFLPQFRVEKPEFTHPLIARMGFLKQFEALSAMESLRNDRNNNGGVLIELAFERVLERDSQQLFEFRVISGAEYLDFSECLSESKNEEPKKKKQAFRMSDWILCRRHSPEFPFHDDVVTRFTDAEFYCTFIRPGSSLGQVPVPQHAGHVYIADIDETVMEKAGNLMVRLVVWGTDIHQLGGRSWSLRPRFVDYNLAKTIDHLMLLDAQAPTLSLSLSLLCNPVQFGLETPKVAIMEGNVRRVVASFEKFRQIGLDLANSQREALFHMAKHPLTLLHGPPGTGKTHCLALCILQVLEAAVLSGVCHFHIVMTAFTNSAIDTFLEKLRSLSDRRDGVAHQLFRREELAIVDLRGGSSRAPLPKKTFCQKPFGVAVGSVWSISKRAYQKQPTYDGGASTYLFDMLIIDEASQLQVADATIAIDCVKRGGRIVVAGDHLQLRPLLKAQYPLPAPSQPQIVTGILQALLRDAKNCRYNFLRDAREGAAAHLCSLREQRRMCAPLAQFTQGIYGFPFTSVPSYIYATHYNEQTSDSQSVAQLMAACRSSSLVSCTFKSEGNLQVHLLPYESELRYIEGSCVPQIVSALIAAISVGEKRDPPSIFIITPHRAQRGVVRQALASVNIPSNLYEVDTVDRMQGKEADIVIVCYNFLGMHRVENEMDFIFDLNRVNVAISRARMLCILLLSEVVVNAPMSIVTTPERSSAFSHLSSFYEKSRQIEWKMQLTDEMLLKDAK